jgi:hypothetical protein
MTTAPGLRSSRVGSPQHVVGPEQVDVDDGTEGVGRHVQRRSREVPRSTGDEHIDVAERRMRVLEGRLGGLRIAHVGGYAGRLRAQRLQPRDRSVDLLRGPAHHSHARPAAANPSAIPRLMPLVPPATNTVVPLKSTVTWATVGLL